MQHLRGVQPCRCRFSRDLHARGLPSSLVDRLALYQADGPLDTSIRYLPKLGTDTIARRRGNQAFKTGRARPLGRVNLRRNVVQFSAIHAAAHLESVSERLSRYVHVSISAAILLACNEGLKMLFTRYSINIPHTLGGMLLIIAVSLLGKASSEQSARTVDMAIAFFGPLRDWVARWMPVFFVPSLIALPQATAGIAASQFVKVTQVTVLGWMMSLAVAGSLVQMIRGAAHSEITSDEAVQEAEIAPKPLNPFSRAHYLFWSSVYVAAAFATPLLPGSTSIVGTIFLLAATIVGYMVGVALPATFKRIVHPIVVCAMFGVSSCALWGALAGKPQEAVLSLYMQQGTGTLGAGNLLMAMLTVVVLCDGMRIYLQRKLVQRHALEIFGTTIVSSVFSLFVTAKLAAYFGLEPLIARSLLPRAVTVALALPMTATLGGSQSLTAAMVCFTGLMGAAFGQMLMNGMRIRDEISRGVTQAASAHGMGTSAMAGSEPQALPFCAVTIAVMGTLSNLLLCVPTVCNALLSITG